MICLNYIEGLSGSEEEFHRICLLAKAQKDHLSKLNVPTTATGSLIY